MDDQKQTDPNKQLPLDQWHQYRLRIGRRKFAMVEFRRGGNMTLNSPWKFNSKNLTLTLVTNDPQQSYQVDLERCKTSAEVLDWVMQVASKTWVTNEILASLIHEINRLLYPQGNLCSLGQEQGPVNVKELIKNRLKAK